MMVMVMMMRGTSHFELSMRDIWIWVREIVFVDIDTTQCGSWVLDLGFEPGGGSKRTAHC